MKMMTKKKTTKCLEVFCLTGKLGEVFLEPECTSAWDLAKEVHSRFALPSGTFWRLVIQSSLVEDKDIEVSNVPSVTCVKHSPTHTEKTKVVQEVHNLVGR